MKFRQNRARLSVCPSAICLPLIPERLDQQLMHTRSAINDMLALVSQKDCTEKIISLKGLGGGTCLGSKVVPVWGRGTTLKLWSLTFKSDPI